MNPYLLGLVAFCLVTSINVPTPTTSPVIAAAGDIACAPTSPYFNGTAEKCQHRAVADLILAQPRVDAVLALGDVQYEEGEWENFNVSYDPAWGRLKNITRPVPGNHEYETPGATGYFAYFGTPGYYSFDLGDWHIIALNSGPCGRSDGHWSCRINSTQVAWLRADLAANRHECTLAYWHHPIISFGNHPTSQYVRAFWDELYLGGADVVLNAHDHHYARLKPSNNAGVPDPVNGIRTFIVGTGGKSHYGWNEAPAVAAQRELLLEEGNTTAFGALFVSLHDGWYEWEFISTDGSYHDSGSASCR